MSTVPGVGSEVAPYDPKEYGNVGMEDVSSSDLVIPRLSIDHPNGVFVNNLSKEEFAFKRVVILGLVKQRTMWDSDVQTGDKPQCKSTNFEVGFPQMRTDVPLAKQFPWNESNFNPNDFPPSEQYNGHVGLPCEACVFTQWGKDARSGKSIPPACSEQHVYPIMFSEDENVPEEEMTWTTAIVSFHRTGLQPSKRYISSFSQKGKPMFTSYTDLSLNQQSRGNVEYSVPIFKQGPDTSRAHWKMFADSYLKIREFLREPPRANDEMASAPAPSSNANAAPVQQAAPVHQQSAPVQQAAPVQQQSAPAQQQSAPAMVPDDDLPF